jgi:hypothetical protein
MSVLKMNKEFWLGGLAVFALVFAGCLTNDTKKDSAPEITTQPTDATVDVGGTVTVSLVASGSGLTYQWFGTNSSGNMDTLKDKSKDGATITGSTTSTMKITGVLVEFDGKQAKCVVTNAKGSVTSNTVTLHVNVPWPAEQTLAVGAQGNPTLGTAVDLDSAAVLTTAQVNLNSYVALHNVDILFAFSSGTLQIMTPAAAKDAGDVPLALNYPDAQITMTDFVSVTAKPADQLAAAAAYAAGTKDSSADVVVGDMFVVRTSYGNYAYVKVDSITGTGNTAAASLAVTVTGLGAGKTEVVIDPHPLATAAGGGTIVFTASLIDQSGNPVNPQPQFIWSCGNPCNPVVSIVQSSSNSVVATVHDNVAGTCGTVTAAVVGDSTKSGSSHIALAGSTTQYPCPPN